MVPGAAGHRLPAYHVQAMPPTLLMLPPQRETTREWAARLAATLPEMSMVVAESDADAARAIGDADAAFGTIPDALLRQAGKLRWLQAPQAAPPAGYYTPELIAHPVVVTNFREIYNDHIGAHIMAFVLAFARGFHHYFPRQLRREWRREPNDSGVIHLPEATALIVGVGGIGAEAARLAPAARRLRHPHGAAHAGDRGLHAPGSLPADEAHRVLHQHRAWEDDAARRPGGGAPRGGDRRGRARRLRARAAAGRPSAVDDGRRAHHAAH